jgi:hypothetical protein
MPGGSRSSARVYDDRLMLEAMMAAAWRSRGAVAAGEEMCAVVRDHRMSRRCAVDEQLALDHWQLRQNFLQEI